MCRRHCLDFVACAGVMSLHEGGDSGWPNYTWQDDSDPGFNIAAIDRDDQYIIQGNHLYVINRHTPNDFDKARGVYGMLFKTNGTYQEFTYPSQDKIPTLLIFDTDTANVTPYLGIEDVPQEQRQYFEELELRG